MKFPDTLPVPREVLRIAQRLEDAGYEAWCVGGAVRDNLLELESRDFDLATSAPPADVQRLFRRTVPIGIEHGTVAVLDGEGTPHEVTTFRRDVRTDGRHAVVEFGASLEDDLARRDFTINAIAYHPVTHEWRDPFAGASDLDARVVRAVGEAERRFREDYLRIVRAVRFAARFGFDIEPATWDAARGCADGLEGLSAERIRDEWFKGLATARRPSALVRLWAEVGAVSRWLPELSPGQAGLDDLQPRDPVLMTAFLSNDPEATLTRLRASNADIERARRIGQHRGFLPEPDERSTRRWLSAVGPVADDLVAIATATESGGSLADRVRAVRASGAPLVVADLAVTGRDILAAGVPEGPAVGRILIRLLDEVLDEPARNERTQLLARAAALAEEGS